MSDSIDHYGCILTSTLCFSVAALSLCGHLLLGFIYYIKTGTVPLREKIYTRVVKLREAREARKRDESMRKELHELPSVPTQEGQEENTQDLHEDR